MINISVLDLVSFFLSALSQNPGDHCIATVVLGNVLNVPPGTVCFECVINGAVAFNATFEIDNLPIEADGKVLVYGVLVVFNTSAIFHPSTENIVRCFSGMQINQSSVYLEGNYYPLVCVSMFVLICHQPSQLVYI